MPPPSLPNELFTVIAEQTPDLRTLLSLLLSNHTLSTLLAPVLLRKDTESDALSGGKTALEYALSRNKTGIHQGNAVEEIMSHRS
jgi:hypothetical protein